MTRIVLPFSLLFGIDSTNSSDAIYESHDGGDHWRVVSGGASIKSVALLGDSVYEEVYSLAGGFRRGGIAEVATSVGQNTVGSGTVEQYSLSQNYPNPFNPTTVISGQWTADSWVKLVVYDILGREVATLANGRYPAGRYSFTFDAHRFASGVYFYRLQAGEFSSVKKMMLIK